MKGKKRNECSCEKSIQNEHLKSNTSSLSSHGTEDFGARPLDRGTVTPNARQY